MFIDFHTADAWSAPSVESCGTPIAARCWLTSVSTCEAKLELTVPQDESGLQTLSARAREVAGTRVSKRPAEKTTARAIRRCGVRLTGLIIGKRGALLE